METALKPLSFGLAVGILWGLGLLVLGLMAAYLNWGKLAVDVIASVYPGYAPTLVGSLIGLVWGFVDGTIAAAIVALLYNYLASAIK